MKIPSAFAVRLLTTTAVVVFAFSDAAMAADAWVGTWATSPQRAEPGKNEQAPNMTDATVRQVLRVSVGGNKVRVRFSNAFGDSALTLTSAHIAVSAGAGAIRPDTDRALTFDGAGSVSIPPGALMVSDALDFGLAPLSDIALTVHLSEPPHGMTGHPGSRSTSYIAPGDLVSAADLPEAAKVDHWYFINGIDVPARAEAAAIVVLGDSITDGHGSTTNGNDRWPDFLARILQANPQTSDIGVLNHGIGGNRILRDGTGPNALARFDRDVIAQTGVRWLIVLEGVNDIGTTLKARAAGQPGATAADLIASFKQIVARAHAHGIKVYGATILPFAGFAMYDSPQTEAERESVNQWIRTGGVFDAVIDLDLVTRDTANPAALSAADGSTDHLHPGPSGYKAMAEVVDLGLFAR